MNIPVFDLHCDTALELIDPAGKASRSLRRNNGHIDLEKGKRLAGYTQLFAIFTTPNMRSGYSPEEVFDAVLKNIRLAWAENSDLIQQARNAGEAEEIIKGGKIAGILSLEGPAGIGFDPGRLPELYEIGFRMSTLTWNEQNPLAGSHKTGGGLTAQGREYVRIAQKLGIRLDVSHLSEEAFWDMMDITEGPISASHSNSRAVWDNSRNLTDRQFKAICETGGVAGLNLYSDFIGEGTVTLDSLCDHAVHWLELGGGKHIALGGDLDGCDALPVGFTGVDCYPALADAMAKRGISEAEIRDIFWNNAARLLNE